MRIERVETDDQLAAALAIRRAVFVAEQEIEVAADRDGSEQAATHLLAVVEADADEPPAPAAPGDPRAATDPDERAVGTLRFRETDAGVRGERLAVLPAHRGTGVGSALTERLIQAAAARGGDHLVVHAQVDNVPFCRAHGFESTGDRFDEVGIEHVEMIHPLDDG